VEVARIIARPPAAGSEEPCFRVPIRLKIAREL